MNERSLTTKELIGRTALRLFVKKGVTETRIRDIATAAHIAEGTLYRHYASKEELAWDLFETNLRNLVVAVDLIQKQEPSLKRKLDAMIHYFCEQFDSDWVMFSYLLLSQHEHLHGEKAKKMRTPGDVIFEVIEAGMESGEIPRHADSHVVSAMILGVVLEVAMTQIYGKIDHDLSSLAESLSAASWRVAAG